MINHKINPPPPKKKQLPFIDFRSDSHFGVECFSPSRTFLPCTTFDEMRVSAQRYCHCNFVILSFVSCSNKCSHCEEWSWTLWFVQSCSGLKVIITLGHRWGPLKSLWQNMKTPMLRFEPKTWELWGRCANHDNDPAARLESPFYVRNYGNASAQ